MSENTQPESTAKVEEIALRIAMEMFGEDWPNAVGKLEEMLRPYIPSQPRLCPNCDPEDTEYQKQECRCAAPVAPVSGNGPEPQASNNGLCSCCGTKLVRQELTLPHYVDWCSNCNTWAGAQPTPKVEEK